MSADDVAVPYGLTSTRLSSATSCLSNITSGNAILDGDPQTCFTIEHSSHTFTLYIETPVLTVNVTIYTYNMDCKQDFHYKVYSVVPDKCISVARTLCKLELVEKWNLNTDTQIQLQGQKCTYKCDAICSADNSWCWIMTTIDVRVASIRKGHICETELYDGTPTQTQLSTES